MNYDNSKGTAPTQDNLNTMGHDCPRSASDLSCIEDTSLQIGAITPIDLIDCDINSDINAHYSLLALLRNPFAKRFLSGMRIYLHAYYSRKSDLWEGYPVHVSGGRKGDINKSIPKILLRDHNYSTGETTGTRNDYSTPMSLADHLGIPVTSVDTTKQDKNEWFTRLVIKDSYNGEYKSYMNNVNFVSPTSAPDLPAGGFCANALPFVMYQKICRDNFFATDLLLNNKEWYPDFDDHWILPYNIPEYEYDLVTKQFTTYKAYDYVNVLSHEHPTLSKASLDQFDWSASGSVYVPLDDDKPAKTNSSIKNKEVPPVLTALHFRQFRGDYFNTASIYPDLIRGEVPTVEQFGSLNWSDVVWNDMFQDEDMVYPSRSASGGLYSMNLVLNTNAEINKLFLATTKDSAFSCEPSGGGFPKNTVLKDFTNGTNRYSNAGKNDELLNLLNRVKYNSTFTRNELNSMLVATAMKERMARTDGSYNQIMESMFNYNPRMHDRRPTYIGGAYMDLQLSDVVSTSSTSDEDLGTTVSRGLAMGDLSFNFHCPDNGYIMVVAEVVPDTFYCNQGIDTLWTKTLHDDVYFPIQNNLGPVAIRNKEIYMSRTSAENEDVFGYTERGRDKMSRRNRLSGLFALPSTIAQDDSVQHMKRHFDDLPKLNNDFVTMSPKNIDMEVFTDEYDIPFNLCIAKNVTAVQPRPYSSVPFDGGIKF